MKRTYADITGQYYDDFEYYQGEISIYGVYDSLLRKVFQKKKKPLKRMNLKR